MTSWLVFSALLCSAKGRLNCQEYAKEVLADYIRKDLAQMIGQEGAVEKEGVLRCAKCGKACQDEADKSLDGPRKCSTCTTTFYCSAIW